MDKNLASVIKYFAIFGYNPSFNDIYTFFPEKISKKQLKTLIKAKKYTLPEYPITSQKSKVKSQNLNSKVKNNNITIEQYNNFLNKQRISKIKLSSFRFKLYIKLLSFFPQIKLIGLSGSIAMMNASEDDDIDLFIITAKNRLWTGRFLAVTIAYLMGLKRQKGRHIAPNKVCLNLFFDEADLTVPRFKQTEFVGHEVLQMKPIINKNQTYEKFLNANRWILSFFPNALKDYHRLGLTDLHGYPRKSVIQNLWKSIGWIIELLFKNLQLTLINRHKTSEIITKNQLWFHPVDFGKKI